MPDHRQRALLLLEAQKVVHKSINHPAEKGCGSQKALPQMSTIWGKAFNYHLQALHFHTTHLNR